MNNYRFNYKKKYHYSLKYIILGLPILLILFSLISYNSQFDIVVDSVSSALSSFKYLTINSWYDTLLNSVGITDLSDSFVNILSALPLYIIWVYALDLILDVLLIPFNIVHSLCERLGGKSYE